MKEITLNKGESLNISIDGMLDIYNKNNKTILKIHDFSYIMDNYVLLDHKKYKHDCNKCEYIATFRYLDNSKYYDCYFCKSDGINGTIIARYGDNGSDYQSSDTNNPFTDVLKTVMFIKENNIRRVNNGSIS